MSTNCGSSATPTGVYDQHARKFQHYNSVQWASQSYDGVKENQILNSSRVVALVLFLFGIVTGNWWDIRWKKKRVHHALSPEPVSTTFFLVALLSTVEREVGDHRACCKKMNIRQPQLNENFSAFVYEGYPIWCHYGEKPPADAVSVLPEFRSNHITNRTWT